MAIAPIPGAVQAHLAGQSLFHGTDRDIPVGGAVVPGKLAGHSHYGTLGHSGQKSNEHAFASTNENDAWTFADHASQMTGGRAQVATVAPTNKTMPGVYNSLHPHYRGGEDLHEWTAPHFPVTGHVDIKPGHQGTFPQVNWREHSTQDRWAGDPNHPDPHEVENGHYGSSLSNEHIEGVIAQQKLDHESKQMHPGQGELFNNRSSAPNFTAKFAVE